MMNDLNAEKGIYGTEAFWYNNMKSVIQVQA